MLSLPSLLLGLLALPSLLNAAPIPIATLRGRDFQRRATACFLPGTVALPAEVEDGIAGLLAAPVTCKSGFAFKTVPDVVSGGIQFSNIDFQKSSSDALGFSLAKFTNLDLATLQNQLNVYLAVEAGARSIGDSTFTAKVKVPKFFIQFQIARVNEANGVTVGAAGTVAHQLGKVQKNAGRASAAELSQLLALSTTPVSAASPSAAVAAPVVAATTTTFGSAFTFKTYSAFQISSSSAGTALAKAKAIFPVPDFKTFSKADHDSMSLMRSAAEAAETDFNAAIAAAGGVKTSAGAALQVGKIQNKVLKLFAFSQLLQIDLAQGTGTDVAARLLDSNTKLAANVKIDAASKGKSTTGLPTSKAATEFA